MMIKMSTCRSVLGLAVAAGLLAGCQTPNTAQQAPVSIVQCEAPAPAPTPAGATAPAMNGLAGSWKWAAVAPGEGGLIGLAAQEVFAAQFSCSDQKRFSDAARAIATSPAGASQALALQDPVHDGKPYQATVESVGVWYNNDNWQTHDVLATVRGPAGARQTSLIRVVGELPPPAPVAAAKPPAAKKPGTGKANDIVISD
jgi:hypothetical protein